MYLPLTRRFCAPPDLNSLQPPLAGQTCSGTVQYLEMFKELVVDHIVYNLDRKGTNLRILFKKYDFGSYGYITVEQVCVCVCHALPKHTHSLTHPPHPPNSPKI